jgi:hypothetical protein
MTDHLADLNDREDKALVSRRFADEEEAVDHRVVLTQQRLRGLPGDHAVVPTRASEWVTSDSDPSANNTNSFLPTRHHFFCTRKAETKIACMVVPIAHGTWLPSLASVIKEEAQSWAGGCQEGVARGARQIGEHVKSCLVLSHTHLSLSRPTLSACLCRCDCSDGHAGPRARCFHSASRRSSPGTTGSPH